MLGRADNSTELVKLMEDPPRGNRVGICGGIPTGLAAPIGFDGARNKKGVFFFKNHNFLMQINYFRLTCRLRQNCYRMPGHKR